MLCTEITHPVLHFYQVPSKYSEGFLSNKGDTKSISNKTKGDNFKTLPFLLLALSLFVIFDSDYPLISCPLCNWNTLRKISHFK